MISIISGSDQNTSSFSLIDVCYMSNHLFSFFKMYINQMNGS